MSIEFLPFIFFIIALLYSAVGFGGGSSYLAIMSLFLTGFYEIRSTALVLNLCVVSIGTMMFIRHRVFNWRAFWPFLAGSVSLAYAGAQLRLSEQVFFLILGSCLLLAGAFMILKYLAFTLQSRSFSRFKKGLLGSGVGLLAGVSGIGGGIYLSPLLNLLSWQNPRTIASLASVFIMVNSIAGLAGLFIAGTFQVDPSLLIKLIVAVVAGGSIGSYLSNEQFNLRILGLLTAVLVIYVGLRLILLHGYGIKI